MAVKNKPLISVIIPSYNRADTVGMTIDSILAQKVDADIEIVIGDDCSTDNSVEVIKTFLKEHPGLNVKTFFNKKNTGSPFVQWSKGFQEATGDYVWIAEADDICSETFLDEVMKSFDDPEVVLSYSDSNRIDENGNITATSCKDWMLAASKTHWNTSYCITGEEEIRIGLSIMNTIPNVSAVVFKQNSTIPNILKQAGQYTLSGDWFFYTKILQTGKIAFHAKSLNYFRKHTGSISTDIKKAIEVKEVLDIQKIIREDWPLNSEEIHRQSYRYESLLEQLDNNTKKELLKKTVKKIAWIIPAPIKGSGGVRTIIDNTNSLVRRGYLVDAYIEEDFESTPESMRKKIEQYYGECLCRIYIGISMRHHYDLIFATFSLQTDYILRLEAPHKAYFIQDFEPWFEPRGGLSLQMENTYRHGLQGVSIGNWLAHKINSEYGMNMRCFNFCADTDIYKPLPKIQQEEAICFIFQPEKPRRCHQIGLSALYLVKKLRPETTIYLYGSNFNWEGVPEGMQNLKIISPEECNKLYNKCKVGLCLSSSNPSRIPFEMMAAGLPVVDLYLENNLYDMPSSSISLAEPTPEAIATALIQILDNNKKQKQMSEAGIEFMSNYPINKGFEQFGTIVDTIIDNKNPKETTNPNKKYKLPPVTPSKKLHEMALKYTIPNPVPIAPTSPIMKKIVKSKRTINSRYKTLIRKIFKV